MNCIQQQSEHDCGAACLAAISAHYGRFVSLAEVRALLPPEEASVADIEYAGMELSFEIACIHATDTQLAEAQLPCIALITGQNELPHYIVVYGVDSRYIRVMDPASGRRHRYDRSTFAGVWKNTLILLIPGTGFGQQENPLPFLMQVRLLLYPHRHAIAAALTATACYTLLSYASALFIAILTDHVLTRGASTLLPVLGGVMLVAICLQQIAGVWRSLLLLRISRLLDARLIGGFCRHLLRLPLVVFDRYRTGELLTRVGNAVQLRNFACDLVIRCAMPFFTLVFLFPLLLGSHGRLALLFTGTMAGYLICHFVAARMNRNSQQQLIAAQSNFEAELTHTLRTVQTHRLSGTEALAMGKLEARLARVLHTEYRSGLNRIFSETAADSISQLTTLALLWLGGVLVLGGTLKLGELLALFALSGYFHRAAYQLAHLSQTWHDARVAGSHLQDIQGVPATGSHRATLLQPTRIGEIRFEGISFGYSRRLTVFKNLSCHFPAGQITVVTGESGSGKSTLIHLLTKRYTPSHGVIRLGRHSLHLISLRSIQQGIGIVIQHPEFMAATIAENICLPQRPDASRLAEVLDSVGLTAFVNSLPLGWDTQMEESGGALSVGQRQCIAIARALYKCPEVLILDEGTSALDGETEAVIHRCMLDCRSRGMTIIFISHRPQSLAIADHHVQLTPIQETLPHPSIF